MAPECSRLSYLPHLRGLYVCIQGQGRSRPRQRARTVATKAINQIRWIITVNLVVGIASVVIGVTGRYRA